MNFSRWCSQLLFLAINVNVQRQKRTRNHFNTFSRKTVMNRWPATAYILLPCSSILLYNRLSACSSLCLSVMLSTASKERRPCPSCRCCSGWSVHCLYEAGLLERHPVLGQPERDQEDPEGLEISSAPSAWHDLNLPKVTTLPGDTDMPKVTTLSGDTDKLRLADLI